jgi:STE24 endopeptidase
MLIAHAAFLLLLVGTEAVFAVLSVLNVRHAADNAEAAAEFVEDPAEMCDYHRTTTGLSVLQSWLSLAAVLLALYAGLFGEYVAAVESLGLGFVPSGVVFALGLLVLVRLGGVPFDLFGTFVVEEVFGFNEQGPALWLRDFAVGLAVAAVLTAGVGAVVLLAVAELALWWVAAWAVLVAFSLAMLVVYPRVIAPLFNDFEPVETGDLRDAVETVFDRAGFTCSGIRVMDASRRSSHSNAYFVGFGNSKRVVLFDTLVDRMELPEVQAVLAHELAHWKRAHVWKQVGASALRLGVGLVALQYLVESAWLYEMFGVPQVAYAGLALGWLWLDPLSRLSAPLTNRLSLAHEREADRFATDTVGGGEMAAALRRLVSENLSNPFPHPWYAAFHYTHPPVPDRIQYVNEHADEPIETGADVETGDSGGSDGPGEDSAPA